MQKLEIGEKNKVLRTQSEKIKDIKDQKIQKLIEQLIETLEKIETGVGLAASQIGKNLKIFVIHKELANKLANNHEVYINPKIIKKSDKEIQLEEGCLSLPNIWGLIKRSEKIKIEAFDENGKKFKIKAEGFLAQVFQHEIDHLNGILFIDRTLKTWEISLPQK